MGVLRLFLALCVVAGHSLTSVFGVISPNWSTYAVSLFFMISGFYMAFILDQSYRGLPVLTFYYARALRIYPTYLLCLVLSVISYLYGFGSAFFYPISTMALWQKIYLLFCNLFVFGQDLAYLICFKNVTTGECYPVTQTLMNPPAWSIAVELSFYLIAPFIVRSLLSSSMCVLFGAVYIFLASQIDIEFVRKIIGNSPHLDTFAFTYYLFPASIMFFGLGAVSYFLIYKRSLSLMAANSNYQYYISIIIALFLIANYVPIGIAWWQILAYALSIPSLFVFTMSNKLDRVIGELSFPIYMVHFPVFTMLQEVNYRGPFTMGTVVAACSIILGIVVYLLIDRPIESWRHRMLASARRICDQTS